MNIITMTLGAYQTNCYMVWGEGDKCVLIDPGYEPAAILEQVRLRGKSVEAILLTHGHFDHVGGVEAIVKAAGCRLWMHEGDWSQQKTPENAFFYPIANCDFTEVSFCEDAERIRAGGLTFTVLTTPGHTWGSVCYLCENAVFSGDTLFAGSCGRTDLPGGDREVLGRSLHRLAQMEKDCRVYPGHGEDTTLSREKACNPYMR